MSGAKKGTDMEQRFIEDKEDDNCKVTKKFLLRKDESTKNGTSLSNLLKGIVALQTELTIKSTEDGRGRLI